MLELVDDTNPEMTAKMLASGHAYECGNTVICYRTEEDRAEAMQLLKFNIERSQQKLPPGYWRHLSIMEGPRPDGRTWYPLGWYGVRVDA